jgi:hypothetical protein
MPEELIGQSSVAVCSLASRRHLAHISAWCRCLHLLPHSSTALATRFPERPPNFLWRRLAHAWINVEKHAIAFPHRTSSWNRRGTAGRGGKRARWRAQTDGAAGKLDGRGDGQARGRREQAESRRRE